MYLGHFLWNCPRVNATRHRSLVISQYWFRQWLGAVKQQAITWANVDPDLCRHSGVTRPELTHWPLGDLNYVFFFTLILTIGGWGISYEIVLSLEMNMKRRYWFLVNINSVNGFASNRGSTHTHPYCNYFCFSVLWPDRAVSHRRRSTGH